MKRTLLQLILLFSFSLLLTSTMKAQRISFGLSATDDIVLTPLNLGELNFNLQQPIILPGQTVTISMTDNTVAILSIEARADLDVTVTIDAPLTLDLDATHKIPLSVGFAYSNMGATNEIDAKKSYVQVPTGFTSITFPVFKRAAGLPTPPPTPDHVGYTAAKRTAYLFIYGTLGMIPYNTAVGAYSGDINIHVSYNSN